MIDGDIGSGDAVRMEPWNLALRFVLEVACVAGIGAGVGSAGSTLLGIVAAVAAVVVWGTFATPDDPSRSGRAPVPVPGVVRLALELAVFGAGVAGWFVAGQRLVAVTVGLSAVIHHLAAGPRLAWLVTRR